ncbi:hypothetical protein J31TS3_11930 [Paenibacillus lactis]|nr:hypothetical protein J31TS3_11930 [Paenibacillus lactis]
MIAFIISRGSQSGTLQTKISLKAVLPDWEVITIPETRTADSLNQSLQSYDESYFLTLYGGDILRPELGEQLQGWMQDLETGDGGIVIQPRQLFATRSPEMIQNCAVLWRTSAVVTGTCPGFAERNFLPFDSLVLFDQYVRIRHAYRWKMVSTDAYMPARTYPEQPTRNPELEVRELMPIIQRSRALIEEQRVALCSPVISVVICTYNNADYLPWAVRSVMAQTGPEWELLIIDDGSTDATPAYLETLQGDPRIRCYRQRQNEGKAACLNEALKKARGKWLLELDADDWLAPESLIRLSEAALNSEEPGAIYADHYEWTERRSGELVFRGVKKPPEALSPQWLLEEGPALAPRMFRVGLLIKHNGWSPSVPQEGRLYEDIELLARLATEETMRYLPLPLYHRRIRSGSMTRMHEHQFKAWSLSILDRINKALADDPFRQT